MRPQSIAVPSTSPTADLNSADTLTAAADLAEFTEDKPWAHIDIAGTSWDVGRPYVGKGPSGYGVRLLLEWLNRRASAAAPVPAGA